MIKRTILLVLSLGGCATHTLKPFASDGCSLYPEGTREQPTQWEDCCTAHDRAYWQGGTRGQREAADEQLRQCVLERTHDEARAKRMYEGVRLGGSAALPTPFRWGYGWGYGRGYEALTPKEQAMVDAQGKGKQP